MSKAIYFYGVMKASKTAQLLTMDYNYRKHGIKPVIIKPKLDGKGDMVTSRLGLKTKADVVVDTVNDNQLGIANSIFTNYIANKTKVVLVDEAQFLSPYFIKALSSLCKIHDVDVYAFGLLKDYKNSLFEGAEQWLELVDSIREIKTTCELCNHKATCNALEDKDGILVKETFSYGASSIHTGDTEYHVYCQYHFIQKVIEYKNKEI